MTTSIFHQPYFIGWVVGNDPSYTPGRVEHTSSLKLLSLSARYPLLQQSKGWPIRKEDPWLQMAVILNILEGVRSSLNTIQAHLHFIWLFLYNLNLQYIFTVTKVTVSLLITEQPRATILVNRP